MSFWISFSKSRWFHFSNTVKTVISSLTEKLLFLAKSRLCVWLTFYYYNKLFQVSGFWFSRLRGFKVRRGLPNLNAEYKHRGKVTIWKLSLICWIDRRSYIFPEFSESNPKAVRISSETVQNCCFRAVFNCDWEQIHLFVGHSVSKPSYYIYFYAFQIINKLTKSLGISKKVSRKGNWK